MKLRNPFFLLLACLLFASACEHRQMAAELSPDTLESNTIIKTYHGSSSVDVSGSKRDPNPNNNPCDINELNLNILFIGNEQTAHTTTDIPAQLYSLAIHNGQSISGMTYITGPNYDLVDHLNDPSSVYTITSGNWDYVILQPHRDALNPASSASFNTGVPGLTNLINANNPNAKILLYMVVPEAQDGSLAYNNLQSSGIPLYTNMANNYSNMFVVPVGPAFTSAYNGIAGYQPTTPDELRYDATQHFLLKDPGGFIGAVTFYSAIFGNKPCIPAEMFFFGGTALGSVNQVVPQYHSLAQIGYMAGRYTVHHSPSVDCNFSYPVRQYPCKGGVR